LSEHIGQEKEFEQKMGTSALVLLRALPGHMQDAAIGYLLYGHRHGGDFLSAVMANDLKESFARADYLNEAAMKRWAQFLYGVMPVSPVRSYGSKEIVAAWQEMGGLRGMEKKMAEDAFKADISRTV
jgi:hypothetical protein